jgi:hypothetical protein
MPLGKTRRHRLGGAALFVAASPLEAFITRYAQTKHTIILFVPEVGYFVAFCFLLMAIFLIISALRKQ